MAVEMGTAANYLDLLDKLRIFATTNAALVAAGQQWVTKRWTQNDDNSELILCGPGLAGADAVYVGVQSYKDSTNDFYNWRLQGFTGYNAEASFHNQPGAINDSLYPVPKILLWNSNISYWFVASGRRIVVVAKVSTVYEACYLGLAKPYGSPSQIPYPLIVGGSASLILNIAVQRWSTQTVDHRHFADPGMYTTSEASGLHNGSLRVLNGVWLGFRNWHYSNYTQDGKNPSTFRMVWPYMDTIDYSFGMQENREALGGNYPLLPLILLEYDPGHNVFGELDGCFAVSGHDNAAENIVTSDGFDHLVVQNVFRTTRANYWALRLA